MESRNNIKDADRQQKMSRALGAAFLSHQVAELEKTVSGLQLNGSGRGRGGMRGSGRGRGRGYGAADLSGGEPAISIRRSTESPKPARQSQHADRIVVDASVLVHALGQMKSWCREGRNEVIIVPLEALNTLDLLKKGTSPLAIRARAASRLLEAQVGTNNRICVQRDDGYILWEDIKPVTTLRPNSGFPPSSPRSSSEMEDEDDARSRSSGADEDNLNAAPAEWMKRTICCAKWETTTNVNNKVALAIIRPSTISLDDNQSFNRFESRATGTLTRSWAKKLGITVLDINADPSDDGTSHGRASSSQPQASRGRGKPTRGLEGINRSPQTRRLSHDHETRGSGLVEKVPSGLPAGKVIRVLARGEKLDP